MLTNFKNKRIINGEEQASKHINVLGHYDDDTLIDKSGKLIKIIKVAGLNFVTKDDQTLDLYKIRRNNLFKSFSSDFAFYFWSVRRRVNLYPSGEFTNEFSKYVNDQYRKQIEKSNMFHTELYLALMTKQPEGFINKGFSLFSYLSHLFDKKAKQCYLAKRHQELNDATHKVMHSLSDYRCELLTTFEKKNVKFSTPLSFLSQLINFDAFPVPLEISDAAKMLPRKRLFFNRKSGSIEMRRTDGSKKFAAVLSIKAYSPITYQNILDELNTLRCEHVITQSFRFYDRQDTKGRLRDQQNEMLQSKDESISQTEQIDEAFDDAASGDVGYGKHHFSLVCYAETQEELNKHIGVIVSRFADVDIACVREDIACEASFWAQLPGQFSYICRAADISTKNMASFASLHNYSIGKIKGNHWGDAVTVLETLSGSPYYFNFHYKDVGNFLIFGAMGSGKTVLAGFLTLQSMKFGGKRIIFDRDRGLEILVRFMDGVYERIKPGIKTGFNPCQLEDTLENRKFLSQLFKKMLSLNGEILKENDIELIEKAIDGLYKFDKKVRQLYHIASYFGANKKGSLRTRFDQWHSDGAHAWLFDNEEDCLNLNPDVIGIDVGSILTDKECKLPALMYLTYRVEQALEGQCGMIFFDEGWDVIGDDYFKDFINNKSRTPRKQNNIFGLATQVANDTIDYGNSKAINESAFCKIFFPNPGADRRAYVDVFGLSEREYEIVKTTPDDEHYFLLTLGRGIHKESEVVRPPLDDLKEILAIISAREDSLLLFDQIRHEVGDDPNIWKPIFLSRIMQGIKT